MPFDPRNPNGHPTVVNPIPRNSADIRGELDRRRAARLAEEVEALPKMRGLHHAPYRTHRPLGYDREG
jgi:hypothetical protein